MQVQVLGTLQVSHKGEPIQVAGPLPRRLLALLASHAATDVSTALLVEGLWGDAPPGATSATLQSPVARLRRALPARDLLRTGPGGYRLAVDPGQVDAHAFADWTATGLTALRREDFDAAADALRHAETIWGGPAYAEFSDCEPLLREGQRLEQLRLTAVQGRVEADLARGLVTGLVSELEALVNEHPTREELWALLVRALYLTGRQADALTTYQQARRFLRAELGVEPGRQLRTVHDLVLRHDARLQPRVGPEFAVPAAGPRAERRLVTVLVADDHHVSVDPEDSSLRVQFLHRLLTRCATGHGGAVGEAGVGPIVAVFGADGAHEDDPLRAIRTGLQVLGQAESQGVAGIGIGISTGIGVVRTGFAEVPAGTVGQAAMNLARSGEAPGIVVDDATRDRCGPQIAAKPCVGGWSVTALLSAGEVAAGPETNLIGREAELDALFDALAVVRQRMSPYLVCVSGEAGIGKTRLLTEFLTSVNARYPGTTILRGRCQSDGEAGGQRALGQLLAQAAGVRTNDDNEAVAAKLIGLPGLNSDRDVQLVLVLFGQALDTASRTELFAVCRRAFAGVADQGPAVLAVEDVHWADDLFVEVIEDLLTQVRDAPLLVITTARPEFENQHPAWSIHTPGSTPVHLHGLTDGEMAAVVAQLDRTGEPRAADHRRHAAVVQRAAGVPLYARELLRAEITHSSSATATPLLGGLHAVISARIDSLPVQHRAVLSDAAVIGSVFSPDAVIAVGNRTPEVVSSVLLELTRREFVASGPSRRSGEDQLMFVHDLVRDVAYDRLLRPARWPPSSPQPLGALCSDWTPRRQVGCSAGLPSWPTARTRPASAFCPRRHCSTRAASTRLPPCCRSRRPPSAARRSRSALWSGMYLYNALFGLGRDLSPAVLAMHAIIDDFEPGPEVVQALGLIAMAQLIEQTRASMRDAMRTAESAIAMATNLDIPASAWIAHGVRGRARVAFGDEHGLSELDEAIRDGPQHGANTSTVFGLRLWHAGALHHWAGPRQELQARDRIAEFAAARGLGYLLSYSDAEKIRVLTELGRLRDAIALADQIDIAAEAQPRWLIVQRALNLADLGELDGRTVEKVRATPPADAADLRHVLGTAILLAERAQQTQDRAAAPGNGAESVGDHGVAAGSRVHSTRPRGSPRWTR